MRKRIEAWGYATICQRTVSKESCDYLHALDTPKSELSRPLLSSHKMYVSSQILATQGISRN